MAETQPPSVTEMVSPDWSVSSRTTAYLMWGEEETWLCPTTIASPGPSAAVDAAIVKSTASKAIAFGLDFGVVSIFPQVRAKTPLSAPIERALARLSAESEHV